MTGHLRNSKGLQAWKGPPVICCLFSSELLLTRARVTIYYHGHSLSHSFLLPSTCRSSILFRSITLPGYRLWKISIQYTRLESTRRARTVSSHTPRNHQGSALKHAGKSYGSCATATT